MIQMERENRKKDKIFHVFMFILAILLGISIMLGIKFDKEKESNGQERIKQIEQRIEELEKWNDEVEKNGINLR